MRWETFVATATITWLGAGACRKACPKDRLNDSTYQYATVEEADGRLALYSGHLIKDKLARGEDVDTVLNVVSFLRLRIPRSIAEEARQSPYRRRFISLGEPQPGVELTFHESDYQSTVYDENACSRDTRGISHVLVPGQPGFTGRAAIRVLQDGTLAAGAKFEFFADRRHGFVQSGGGCSPETEPDCPPIVSLRHGDGSAGTDTTGDDARAPADAATDVPSFSHER